MPTISTQIVKLCPQSVHIWICVGSWEMMHVVKDRFVGKPAVEVLPVHPATSF